MDDAAAWPPYALHVAVGCTGCVVAAATAGPLFVPKVPWSVWQWLGLAVLDGALVVGLGALLVVVVHEAAHWLVYRAAGRRPRLSRNGWAPVVAAREDVPRRLLRVQLSVVAIAVVPLSALLAVLISLVLAPLWWNALVVGAGVALVMLCSTSKDRHNPVLTDFPSARAFRDDGADYEPVLPRLLTPPRARRPGVPSDRPGASGGRGAGAQAGGEPRPL